MRLTQYSGVSNRRAGWNKCAGWKTPNLRNYAGIKLFKKYSKQNIMVKDDNDDQNHHISIKWQWKTTQNPKI